MSSSVDSRSKLKVYGDRLYFTGKKYPRGRSFELAGKYELHRNRDRWTSTNDTESGSIGITFYGDDPAKPDTVLLYNPTRENNEDSKIHDPVITLDSMTLKMRGMPFDHIGTIIDSIGELCRTDQVDDIPAGSIGISLLAHLDGWTESTDVFRPKETQSWQDIRRTSLEFCDAFPLTVMTEFHE